MKVIACVIKFANLSVESCRRTGGCSSDGSGNLKANGKCRYPYHLHDQSRGSQPQGDICYVSFEDPISNRAIGLVLRKLMGK
jgi:hypothetical protein